MADALLFLVERYCVIESGELINTGTCKNERIAEVARTVPYVLGFKGKSMFDTRKPDGTLRKVRDTSWLRTPDFSRGLRLKMALGLTIRILLKR